MSFDMNKDDPQALLSTISFGSLVKAEKSIEKKRRKHSEEDSRSEEVPATVHSWEAKTKTRTFGKPSKGITRESKNAPQEISAKWAVTRKREVVQHTDLLKQVRDPRFDLSSNQRFDESHFRKNYAFLDDYRNDEMEMLKDAILKTKDPKETASIEQKLQSMKSRIESQKAKAEKHDILAAHRTKESEMVRGGKKAYYLKPSAIKEMVQTERESKMNKKQLRKTVEKKRKRVAQKSRKNMPFSRRSEP